jgi:hypothetical protein
MELLGKILFLKDYEIRGELSIKGLIFQGLRGAGDREFD